MCGRRKEGRACPLGRWEGKVVPKVDTEEWVTKEGSLVRLCFDHGGSRRVQRLCGQTVDLIV